MEMDAEWCWIPCRDSKDTAVSHSQPAPEEQEKGLGWSAGTWSHGSWDGSLERGAGPGAPVA